MGAPLARVAADARSVTAAPDGEASTDPTPTRPQHDQRWAAAAARLRRTHRQHLAVLMGFCVAMLVVVTAFAVIDQQAVTEQHVAQDAFSGAAATIQDLHAIHTSVRLADGRISAQDLVALQRSRRDLAEDTTGVNGGPSGRARDDVLRALDQLIVAGRGGGGNLVFPLYVEQLFGGLEGSMNDWFDAIRADQEAAISRSGDMRRRLLMGAAAVLMLLVVAGALVARALSTNGRGLVEELRRNALEQSGMRALAQAASAGADEATLVELVRGQATELLRADHVTAVLGDATPATPELAATGTADATGVSCPVMVGDRRAGAISAWWTTVAQPAAADDQLDRLARGLGLAVEAVRGRARLEMLASTDSLTHLPNHRAFHDALHHRYASAVEDGITFAVSVLDIDGLRAINASFGHSAGDAVLAEIACRLPAVLGPDDVLARISGEQFAWISVGAGRDEAAAAANAARTAVLASPIEPVGEVTVSVGVAVLADAGGGDELMRCADLALRAAKDDGRDTVRCYTPAIAAGTGGRESRGRLAQLREFTALQALARAVDLRDHNTQRHSERVAVVSHLLAMELGWAPERAVRLRQAALVHDVGKVGVPDSVLLKPGHLTSEERAIIETHASLGAQIVSEVLDHEQVSWVRGHHERIDGKGYPDGLRGPQIPDGARLMAVADTWDAMTADRPYRAGMDPERALMLCREVAGTQLCSRGVNALAEILVRGDLPQVATHD